jgi:Cu(I)/Ag(I) efflux system membrane fusion protein
MMTRRTLVVAIVAAAVLAAVVAYRNSSPAPVAPSSVATTPAAKEPKVLYWYDPMHPQQHFDKPGKSPFMDMQLVPKYAQDAAPASAATAQDLQFDARSLQRLGLKLALVERAVLATTVNVVGNIAFNERDTTLLQARSAGFVQRVYDLAVGDVVERGAPLVDLLVPEWLGVQQEILALRAAGDATLLAAARNRALALGMPPATIARIERDGKPLEAFTIATPRAGAIRSLDVRAGMNVAAGAPLATINGIERVWLDMAVPQALAQSIAIGATIEANFAALPAQRGSVVAVLPESDAATRTLRVRAELRNPRGELRPGLLAQVRFVDLQQAPALLVPSSAVIRGGQGDRVIVADPAGGFRVAAVTVGREEAQRSEILQGLEQGQQVVVSGQFLIDSEANLTGQLDRLDTSTPATPSDQPAHGGHGQHEPQPSPGQEHHHDH